MGRNAHLHDRHALLVILVGLSGFKEESWPKLFP